MKALTSVGPAFIEERGTWSFRFIAVEADIDGRRVEGEIEPPSVSAGRAWTRATNGSIGDWALARVRRHSAGCGSRLRAAPVAVTLRWPV